MLKVYEVPLSKGPQKFNVPLAGVDFEFRLTWCQPARAWMLDLATGDGVPLVSAIPLVTGADLLAPYGYLEIPGSLVVQTDYAPDVVPTFDNLGDTGRLYLITEG